MYILSEDLKLLVWRWSHSRCRFDSCVRSLIQMSYKTAAIRNWFTIHTHGPANHKPRRSCREVWCIQNDLPELRWKFQLKLFYLNPDCGPLYKCHETKCWSIPLWGIKLAKFSSCLLLEERSFFWYLKNTLKVFCNWLLCFCSHHGRVRESLKHITITLSQKEMQICGQLDIE